MSPCDAPAVPLNREQRRLVRQVQRGKPAPRRQPRGAAINTMEMARNKAGRLTPAEIAFIMKPAEAGFDALRRGVATLDNWQSLGQLVTMGVAIEASGIVTGLSAQFAAAKAALQAVQARVTAPATPTWGTSTAMRAEELQAVREALDVHLFQLQQLSAGELQRLHRVLVRAEEQR